MKIFPSQEHQLTPPKLLPVSSEADALFPASIRLELFFPQRKFDPLPMLGV